MLTIIREFHSPTGIIDRALTSTEITAFAGMGDSQCMASVLQDAISSIPPNTAQLQNQVQTLINFLTTG